MTTLTGSDTYFTNIDPAYTAIKWEADIDQAVDLLNTYGKTLDLPNMSGVAGNKTLSVSSAEAGAIRALATAIHASSKQSGSQSRSFNIGPLGSSSSGGQSSSGIENLAKDLAEQLRELDVTVG